MLPTTAQKNYYYLLFVLFLCCLGLSSFAKALPPTEYLSIKVVHDRLGMFIYITEHDKVYRKIGVIGPQQKETERAKRERKLHILKLEEKGFELWYIEWNGRYDKRSVFKLLHEYEADGWEMISNEIEMTWDSNYAREHTVENFFFSRKPQMENNR